MLLPTSSWSLFKTSMLFFPAGYGTCAGGSRLKLANAVLEAGVKRYFPWQFDFEVIGEEVRTRSV
jgi:hypothetical protein